MGLLCGYILWFERKGIGDNGRVRVLDHWKRNEAVLRESIRESQEESLDFDEET